MLNIFTLPEIILFFFIYALLGWFTEVLYAFHKQHTFVNRGFLYGPFCPIYAFGIISIILILYQYKNNISLLFILGTIITSLLEYITGYILENVFHSKWWDYSDNKYNLHGRICLYFSLIWGLSSTIVVSLIHPLIYSLISHIPTKLINILSSLIAIYFIIDLSLTILSLIQFNTLITELSNLKIDINIKLLTFKKSQTELRAIAKEDFEVQAKVLRNKYDNTIKKLKSNHIRLLNSFPYATRSDDKTFFKEIKEKLQGYNHKIE